MHLQHGLLAIAAVLAIVSVAKVAPRVGVAVPIALVVVGIGASYLPFVPNLNVDPHLILTVVLPPILYSAAVNVHATDFRRNVKAIGGLSRAKCFAFCQKSDDAKARRMTERR